MCISALKSTREQLLLSDDTTVAEAVFVKYALSMEEVLRRDADLVYDGYERLQALKCAYAAGMVSGVDLDMSSIWPSFGEIYKDARRGVVETTTMIQRLHEHLHDRVNVSGLVKDVFATYPTVGLADLFYAHELIGMEGEELTRETGSSPSDYAQMTYEFYAVVLPAVCCGRSKTMNFFAAMSFACFGEVFQTEVEVEQYRGYEDIPVTTDHIQAVLTPSTVMALRRDAMSVEETNVTMSLLLDTGRLTKLVRRNGFFVFDALLGISVWPDKRRRAKIDENWFGVEFASLRDICSTTEVHPTKEGKCWFNAAADTLAFERDTGVRLGRKDMLCAVVLRSLVFELEPTNDEYIQSSLNLRDSSLGGVARALHQDWLTTSNVLGITNVSEGHFTTTDIRKISVHLQNFVYNLAGTTVTAEEPILPQSMEVVYELYREKGLSSFFTQAVRCAVFSAISNNPSIAEFFHVWFTEDGTLRTLGEDIHSEYLTKSIEHDFGHLPSKEELRQSMLLTRLTDSNICSRFATFTRVIYGEETTQLKSVTLLDICLDYCRQTQTYRSRIEVVLD